MTRLEALERRVATLEGRAWRRSAWDRFSIYGAAAVLLVLSWWWVTASLRQARAW